MNRTAKNCKMLLYILNVMLAGFGVLFFIVGTIMAYNVKSNGFVDDTTIIPITVQIFGTIMCLLTWQSFYGLVALKPGYLTSNAVLNLICMLLHIYFACYLWLGLSHEVLPTVPHLWFLGFNIMKCSIFIPIIYELVAFSISCYVADVMRNSEPLINESPYASLLQA
ncbi:uncharacterized protein [Drosophila kikkawai]|uniref:Uncharacterized protein n=1 Tax=Drosophila kikkawai TaxID=30033 RepID=A0ABM4G9D5_DROKI